MDTLDAIFTRRSVRKYTDQPLAEGALETILRAGMAAPTAANQQPWQFIVVTDKEILGQLSTIHPGAKPAADAQGAIFVCGDLNIERIKGYWLHDCCAATQNMLLAIHALGLGSVWTAGYPKPERVEAYQKLLNLPEHVIPIAILPIGYPAETPEPVDRYKPERVHSNGW